MTRLLGLLLAALLTPASSWGGERAADAGAPLPAALPACIGVKTEAVWVPYGYNHVVTLTNGCKKTAVCAVSTDVAPEAQTATVAPSTSAEIVTFMGSPSSVFTAKIGCNLR